MIKRLLALLAALTLSYSAGAEAFTPPAEPVFTQNAGLQAYFASLEERWGAFYTWPLEAKAWLHGAAESLDLAQLTWLEANCAEAGYVVDWYFPTEALDRAHSLPDEAAVPFAEAEALARQLLGDGALYASFLLDDPQRPVWAFARYENGTLLAEACFDGYTGAPARSDGVAVREAARAFLIAEEASLAQHRITAASLAAWSVTAAYLPSQEAWRVTFTAPTRMGQAFVTLEDGTLALLDIQFFNG